MRLMPTFVDSLFYMFDPVSQLLDLGFENQKSIIELIIFFTVFKFIDVLSL